MATVLIGASKRNLSFADAIHAWLVGLNRALAGASSSGGQSRQTITFVIRPSTTNQDSNNLSAVVSALQRECEQMRQEKMFNFDPQLIDMPAVIANPRTRAGEGGATRISIEFSDGLCRYSALTEGASVAERVYPLNPRRIAHVNSRLLVTDDQKEKYLLGRFLLDYLFPRDLRSQITGSAPIILACNNEAAKVYWELAAQPMDDPDLDVVADQPYLGLARGLTRQLRTVLAPPPEPPPPVGKILRVLLVADTCREHPLPGAHQEAQ